MKIGIMTVFDAVNYGSYLQAFCLQEYLIGKGNDVVMIKRSSKLYEKWRFTSLLTYKPSKVFFKLKLARGYFKSWKKFDIIKSPKELDLLIIGSDEMWEVNNVTFNTIPEYYGVGIDAKKKATYAVSSNSTTKEDILKYPFIKNGLNELGMVAVRDQSTYDAYRPYLKVEPVFTVDPTLILDLNDYAINTTKNNYILCYTYTFKDYMIENVKSLSKRLNKRIIVVGQKFDWADECVAADAFEFLGLIKNADFIVTDTFHGTTLSIALRKQFVSFAYKPKVYRTLELFHLLDRNVDGFNDLYDKFVEEINYDEIFNLWINPLKIESEKYLDNLLGERYE